MDISQCLLTRPREKSGSTTSKRYDYQKNWSLYKILELLKSDKDFIAFLDYHEDFVIMYPDEEKFEFYQIKCVRRSSWTKGQLTKRDKGKQGLLSSILGKLIYNLFIFGSFVKNLNFVSNSPVNLKLKDGRDSKRLKSFSLQESSDKGDLCLKISSELGKNKEDIISSKIYFIKTDLNEDGSETYVLGRLAEYLAENYSHLSSKCKSLYQTLFREIQIRCNFDGEFENIEDCLSKKGISKKELVDILGSLEPERTSKEIWALLENRMNTENWNLNIIQGIKDKWNKYNALSKDKSDFTFQKMRKKIIKGVSNSKSSVKTLQDLLDKVTEYYNNCKEVNEKIYSGFISTSILFEFYA